MLLHFALKKPSN